MADKEYIEREAVEKFITKGLNNPDKSKAYGYDAVEILSEVHHMDAADVVEVRRGEWERYVTGNGWDFWEDLICPFCEKKHEKPRFKMNFCPNCGADMRGDKSGRLRSSKD